MMTINNKSERNHRGKCLGWPVTSYSGANSRIFFKCNEAIKMFVIIQVLRTEPSISRLARVVLKADRNTLLFK